MRLLVTPQVFAVVALAAMLSGSNRAASRRRVDGEDRQHAGAPA